MTDTGSDLGGMNVMRICFAVDLSTLGPPCDRTRVAAYVLTARALLALPCEMPGILTGVRRAIPRRESIEQRVVLLRRAVKLIGVANETGGEGREGEGGKGEEKRGSSE
jgi:hypothetical protein